MGVSWRTVEWLRSQGHDAVHLRDEGLQRMPDSEIMVKAREETRILLTMDLDFPALLAASGGRFPSVVVFRLANERPENVNEKLSDVLERFGDVLTDGAIVSVRESLVRLRKLPLKG
jgi:predicted nuclease of predicted toxin-antitoxin system